MERSLTAYRVFYEVAAEGNISKAARKLNISQPAISKTLSRLERDLDAELLKRSSRGVRMTESGEALYSNLREAFEYIEKGEQELRLIKESEHGHIRIGGATTLSKYLLVPYLREFIMAHPFIKIAVDNHSTAETTKSVENGSTDVGIVVTSHPKKGLKFIKLMDVEDTFICTPEYLRYCEEFFGIDSKRPDLEELFKNANFMLLFKDNDSRKHMDEYMRANSLQPLRRMEASTMDLLIDFARISVGIAAVIKEFVEPDLKTGTLVEIPLKVPVPKRQAGFIYLESNTNEALKKFLDCVR